MGKLINDQIIQTDEARYGLHIYDKTSKLGKLRVPQVTLRLGSSVYETVNQTLQWVFGGDLQAKVWEVIPSSADKPVVVINRGTVLVTEQANLPDLRNEGVADITGINIQPTHPTGSVSTGSVKTSPSPTPPTAVGPFS
jgi:hypothetical protein